MMGMLVDVFTVVSVVAGLVLFVAGTAGLLRFPDTLSRLHALSKADNLGLGFVVLGLLPHVGGIAAAVKLVVIWLLVLFSSAIVSQLIARTVGRKPPR